MRFTAYLVAMLSAVMISATASPSANAETFNSNSESSTYVEIQPGDTLSAIAKAHGTTYHRLFNANEAIEHPDVIFAGEKVRIPRADEQLAERSIPVVEATPAPAPAVAPQPVQAAPAPAPVEQSPAPAPAPVPAPAPMVEPEPAPAVTSNAGVWDQLAQCESGGNWAINTGNGFYGGLQFTLQSWQAVGGTGYPHHASKAEQIARAEQLLAIQGWGAWPACSAKLGLR